MPLRRASPIALLVILAFASSSCRSAGAEEVALGRWEGRVDLGEGEEPISLRVLESGGLLDLPARSLFGYPLASFSREGGRLAFAFPWAAGELFFSAAPPAGGGELLEGRWVGPGESSGAFALALSPPSSAGLDYEVLGRTARLPGSLLLPEGDGSGLPVVLILAGSGAIDRDGNNYSVPGRSDSLKALAEGLAACGVASLRYDKRGSGEAYVLVAREEELCFDDYVADAVDALRGLASDGRFARVTLAGHGEGALVAAAALADFYEAGLAAGREGDFGLALLCAPAASPLETLLGELESLPEERRAEAKSIVAAILEGRIREDLDPFFEDFFRPSIQPYLASSFRYDLGAELRRTSAPLVILQGGRDSRPPLEAIERLREARPDAGAVVLEGMGGALKELGPGPDAAYAAFTDPTLPLAGGLAETLADFARSGSVD
ncbi:MAG TPA: alpha/beta hydrolase [Spirochaetales bacterium]|nr:alpha/beta hydrolase [Spirochaetales bacterium]HRY55224.1 alpha/beta hydrolase [Spirochaetia bacterium]HRZ63521.1 alpha/beta hydrolase [Spirochaetia bacterium]